ncbi:MAG: hypothetical protein JSW52_11820 [Candidatus Coatesbacteria bacterium]|nr:MAG: hypothetical protein JSW52_11820 [Candidatus Coatesbacteria bacterium]
MRYLIVILVMASLPACAFGDDNLWLMNASHGEYVFNFYEFDGSTLTYIDTVDCPLTPSQSYGLAYSVDRDTVFWSYAIGSDDSISELDIDFGTDITITVVNTFECPYAGEIRGLDFVDGENAISFTSDPDNMIYTCNADDGTYVSELALGFSNPHPFGVCYDNNGYPHLNEFNGSDIFWYNGVDWNEYANPSSNKGSGMDFYGGYVWETYWTDGVYRFLPDGTGTEFYETPEVGAQLSGLTVFLKSGGGDTGVEPASMGTIKATYR